MGGTLRFGLVVTSDRVSRGLASDKITPMVRRLLSEAGHVLAYAAVAPNSVPVIRRRILEAAARSDVVLVTGGTGPGPRDVSVEAARLVARKELPGLGLLLVERSRRTVGDKALLSRTSAFVVGESLVMVTPGSPDAVEIAVDILLEHAGHVVNAVRGASRWEKGCA